MPNKIQKNNKTVSRSRQQNGASSPVSIRNNAPAAIGVSCKAAKPKVNGMDKFMVTRREFVGTATNGSTTGFALTPTSKAQPGYDFNPSASAMFPWLSQIAGAFERFRFHSLSFEFIPGQSTSTAGRFYAAVDYDYDDAVASTKGTLMGNVTSVESAVWQPCGLTCDPNSLNRDMPYRFVSCTTRGLQVEQRTSNSGYLMVAFDTAVTDCLVDIWVSYTVELVTPVNDYAILQQLSATTSSDVSSTAICPAHGTAFAAPVPKANSTVVAGPITPVTGGGSGVPSLSGYIYGAALSIVNALEVRQALTRGIISLVVSFLETGVTPNAILGASQADVNWQVMDYNGAYLGAVHTLSGARRTIGPPTGSGGTVGQEIISLQTVPLESLFATFPTAKYLAPVLLATAGLGAGKYGFGFTYTD